MSGSPIRARLSRVERPAGMAARLFSASPPCFLRWRGDQGLDGGAVVGVEVAAGDEVVGQRPGLVAGPGLEGGDELGLVDQAVLEGEQAEEQVAVGGNGVHKWGSLVVFRDRPARLGDDPGGDRPRSIRRSGDSVRISPDEPILPGIMRVRTDPGSCQPKR